MDDAAEPWALAIDVDCEPLVLSEMQEYAVTVTPPADVLVVVVGDQGLPGGMA
ncbi:hypothetical protein P4050_00075 [Pseudomonas aeruginosa]|nr:hypothetical protein [Pseudomonas aeruginosa]